MIEISAFEYQRDIGGCKAKLDAVFDRIGVSVNRVATPVRVFEDRVEMDVFVVDADGRPVFDGDERRREQMVVPL